MKRQKKKSVLGHPVNCAQIDKSLNSSLRQSPSWTIIKLIVVCFWPKSNLRLILGWHRSHWRPQKFKNKLTAALFLRTNEKKHTVYRKGNLSPFAQERGCHFFRACYACLSKVLVFCGNFKWTSKGYVEREVSFSELAMLTSQKCWFSVAILNAPLRAM